MVVRRSTPQDVVPPESVELCRRTSLAAAEESEDDGSEMQEPPRRTRRWALIAGG